MSIRSNHNSQWHFDRQCLDPSHRIDGISAFMRLRNEEEFVEQAILSHLPFFDEIVAVYNRCTDRTPEILARLEKLHPEKIKVFEYEPHVYPQGSKEHATLPSGSPHSIVNYSNYALSKTTRTVVTKLDGDHIAVIETLASAVEKIRHEGLQCYLTYHGINLTRDIFGNIAVLKERPLCGGFDIGFFPVSQNTYFMHDPRFEVFKNNLPHLNLGVLFFHAKFLKKCRGFSNYDLCDNPDSRYHEQEKWLHSHRSTIPYTQYLQQQNLDHFELPEFLRQYGNVP